MRTKTKQHVRDQLSIGKQMNSQVWTHIVISPIWLSNYTIPSLRSRTLGTDGAFSMLDDD